MLVPVFKDCNGNPAYFKGNGNPAYFKAPPPGAGFHAEGFAGGPDFRPKARAPPPVVVPKNVASRCPAVARVETGEGIVLTVNVEVRASTSSSSAATGASVRGAGISPLPLETAHVEAPSDDECAEAAVAASSGAAASACDEEAYVASLLVEAARGKALSDEECRFIFRVIGNGDSDRGPEFWNRFQKRTKGLFAGRTGRRQCGALWKEIRSRAAASNSEVPRLRLSDSDPKI